MILFDNRAIATLAAAILKDEEFDLDIDDTKLEQSKVFNALCIAQDALMQLNKIQQMIKKDVLYEQE
ncbi:MAG: hypothetical protein H8E74_02055 [Gammaproteobacteria bacterium]|nr:hypothetical protein [Gammaproteobacteria bacterium]